MSRETTLSRVFEGRAGLSEYLLVLCEFGALATAVWILLSGDGSGLDNAVDVLSDAWSAFAGAVSGEQPLTPMQAIDIGEQWGRAIVADYAENPGFYQGVWRAFTEGSK